MPYKDPEKQREAVRKAQKRYAEKNPQKVRASVGKYKETEAYKKSSTITNWKRYGVIGDYDLLYDSYIKSTNCEVCKKEFKDTYDRCLDHDHQTGLFRQILCRACNTKDSWENIISS